MAGRSRDRRAGAWFAHLLLALPAVALAAGIGTSTAVQGSPGALQPFFGSYVGVAEAEDLATGERQQRDMDIVIQPYGDGGFRLHWINVSRVDGRRDVPGVERQVQTALFEPAGEQDFFVEVPESNPFREREEMQPIKGHPVRWASIAERALNVYSFVVLEDGRYELQTYERRLTDKGVDIEFERIVDGEVLRRITGTTARANTSVAEE